MTIPAVNPKDRNPINFTDCFDVEVLRNKRINKPKSAIPGKIRIDNPESRAAIDPKYPSRFGNCVRPVKGTTKPTARNRERRPSAIQAKKTPSAIASSVKIVNPINARFESWLADIEAANGFSKKP